MSGYLTEIIVGIAEKILMISPSQMIIGTTTTLGLIWTYKSLCNFFGDIEKSSEYLKVRDNYLKQRKQMFHKFYEENLNSISKENRKIIVESTLTELKILLEQERFSSVTIATAFLLKNYEELDSAYAADVNPNETIMCAKWCDDIRRKYKMKNQLNEMNDIYPLLGLPLSFKDVLCVKNFYLTQGYMVNLLNNRSETDSYIVEVLKRKGAVPLLMSSVPQGIYSIETSNRIFGTAINPFNKDRGTGGSSGGEAGLIATKCSAAGIGSDIGGSIRIPSSFCGIYGFRPTSTRISRLGSLEHDNHKEQSPFHLVRSTFGPMARSLSDIILLSENLLGSFTKDYLCNNLPYMKCRFEDASSKKYYKIAVLKSKVNKLSENVLNVLEEVVFGLRTNPLGIEFEISELQFPDFDEIVLTSFKLIMAGNLDYVLSSLKGEPPLPHFQNFEATFLNFIDSVKLSVNGSARMKNISQKTNRNISLTEYWNSIGEVENMKIKMISECLNNGYDAILSPVFSFPAIKHLYSKDLMIFSEYTFFFNIIDFPTGVLPIRLSKKPTQTFSDEFNDFFTEKIRETIDGSEGLPIGLQVSTLTNKDEECLGIMQMIERVLKNQGIIQSTSRIDY